MCAGNVLLPEHFPALSRNTASPATMAPTSCENRLYALLRERVDDCIESGATTGLLQVEIRSAVERLLFELVLRRTRWNRSKAAEIFGNSCTNNQTLTQSDVWVLVDTNSSHFYHHLQFIWSIVNRSFEIDIRPQWTKHGLQSCYSTWEYADIHFSQINSLEQHKFNCIPTRRFTPFYAFVCRYSTLEKTCFVWGSYTNIRMSLQSRSFSHHYVKILFETFR